MLVAEQTWQLPDQCLCIMPEKQAYTISGVHGGCSWTPYKAMLCTPAVNFCVLQMDNSSIHYTVPNQSSNASTCPGVAVVGVASTCPGVAVVGVASTCPGVAVVGVASTCPGVAVVGVASTCPGVAVVGVASTCPGVAVVGVASTCPGVAVVGVASTCPQFELLTCASLVKLVHFVLDFSLGARPGLLSQY